MGKRRVVEREAAGGVRVLFSRARLGRDEASYRRERCARRSRRSPPRLIANDTVDSNILLGLIGAHSGFSSWAKVSIDWPRIGSAIGTSECQQPFLQRGYRTPVEPRASLGVCGSAGSAFQVIGPTTPSAVRLLPCWNDLTASCVLWPKMPSMPETPSNFVITKII